MARILIADDEDLERAALRFIMAGSGLDGEFLIDEARNGHEALRLGMEKKYDAIFLDIKMPGLSGLQVAEAFRGAGILAPIVIISAFDTFEYAQKAIRLGVYEYLLKPAGAEEVVSVLRRTLQWGQEPGALSRKKEESISAISDALGKLENALIGQMKNGGLDREALREYESLSSLEGLSRSAIAFKISLPPGQGAPTMERAVMDIAFSCAEKILHQRSRKFIGTEARGYGFILIYGFDAHSGSPEPGDWSAAQEKGGSATGGFQRKLRSDVFWSLIEAMSHAVMDNAPSALFFGLAGPSAEDGESLFSQSFEGARLASAECPVVRLVPLPRNAEEDVLHFSAADASPRSLGMKALDYIKSGYSKDLTLVSTAEKLGVNSFHLSHAISKELGIGFSELLRRVRINKAKELMIGGGSVKEASYLVGFSDQAYFTRVFKKLEGMNPRQFIEQTAKKYKK